MNAFPLPAPESFNGAVRLTHLGLICAEGSDAATFLHGQLSQDIAGLPADEARLAAFCSPKGRMLASFVALAPQAQTVWLVGDAQVLPAALKRLSMFVMRAKARLSEASATLAIWGLCGEAARQWLGDACPAPVAEGAATAEGAWPVKPHAATSAQIVALPPAYGVERWLWIGPAERSEALSSALPSMSLPAWQWLEVMSGVVRIVEATVDQFVPQMVNFELVGGVNFKKGCYPGQEIVARSQYRGTLKRRTVLMHAKAPLEAGQEVFSATDPAQPGGMVANAAPMPDSDGQASTAWSALVELKWQALDAGWTVSSPQGPSLSPGSLPYGVPMAEGAP